MDVADVRGGILGCLPSCSDKDNGMEQTEPNDPDDPQGPQIPDDPNPPMTGYIAHTMTEGELMYYGHDSEYSKEGGAVYFLYLKDLNNSARGCSVCFYVNVPRQEKGSFTLPAGKYTASSTWEINTFNNKNTTRYRSNWNVVAPKWTQYVAEAGEFEVAIGDNMTYTIRGHMKGGSIQDGGSIMENEAGVAFAFTGRLLISDYSEDYEDPDDPDTPDDPAPEVPEVTMSTGSLYRYNDNIYYLQLKDANPADLYETTFYLKLPASDSPLLASGDYMAATTGEEMTIDASKSFWNFTDKDNHNDKIKNRLKEGTKIHIVSNGDHNYTITGTLEGTSDKTGKNTALKINFSGTLPFEDYADPEPVEPTVAEVTMTIGNLDYYDDPQGRQPDRYLRSVAFVQTTRFGDPAARQRRLPRIDRQRRDDPRRSQILLDIHRQGEFQRPDQKYDQRRFTHRDKQREPQLHRNRHSPGSERHRTGNSH